eukprot:TRINITY_DN30731_c0_g1_i1.p1 TRINITY_DN30731_c0_g1~~TRINITY_DN30731_c0_g1_i1.p1  ORF type:complete len:1060 (-),score=203.81 TRINITY_DN30731_c0_g1_i1:332-3511(-)
MVTEACEITAVPKIEFLGDLEQGHEETDDSWVVDKSTEVESTRSCVLGVGRQASQDSFHSIMAGVRERLGAIPGGLLGSSEPDQENDITASRGSRSATNRQALPGASPGLSLAPPLGMMPVRSEGSKSTIHGLLVLPNGSSKSTTLGQVRMPRRRCACSPCDGRGIPFHVAVICPTLLMLLACVGVFVPMAMFSLQTQRSTFQHYQHSVQVQRHLISTTVLNATQWVMLQASRSVAQAIFTGIVEPPDRAVDTLSGAIHLWRSRDGWDFGSIGQRRTLSYRAWEELVNQWTCAKHNNNLCSGRALSLYAAFANGQVMGSTFRPKYFGSSLLPFAQFSLDAEGGQMRGEPSELRVYEVSSEYGRPQEGLYTSRPFSPTSQPFYTVQELLARQELQNSAGVVGKSGSDISARQRHTQNKKTWSELFVMHPWWAKEDDDDGSHGVLALSWTAPLSLCGNYSCMDGVVAADTTLDLVSFELRLALRSLQQDLARPPWNYALDVENASIFIVNQVSPNFPGQEGLLVGASSLKTAMPSGTLVHAVNSTSSLVSSTAHAVLQHFGSWNASELTGKDDQTFQFSLSAIQQGEFQECDPLKTGMEVALDCYQATTHTIVIGDRLQWLVVAAIPVKAFQHYAHIAMAVEEEVHREEIEAEEQSWNALIKSAIAELLAWVAVLLLGLGTSCLVVRPLGRLSILMRRLGQLDFAHESAEYQKLHRGQLGRVREINELQDGFCRLSKSIETFARFVPDTVVRRLISGDPRASRLNVTKRKVTIMFSDIRDFTRISEELKQDDLVFVLTLYLSVMTRIIESFGGVVGEILGDGILAFWNTPDDVPDHANKALAAALAQQEALGPINAELNRARLPELAIRIGLHTGEVLTGNIGSESKMKFGCIGDPVNLASRLEGLCKIYGVGIICSQAVVDLLSPEQGFACRKLDLVQVKGKKEPTVIYEAMGREPHVCSASLMAELAQTVACEADSDAHLRAHSPVPAERLAQARLYEQALECYSQRCFPEAARLAAQLLAEQPEDVAAERLQRRCMTAAQPWDGQDAKWSPVVAMDFE